MKTNNIVVIILIILTLIGSAFFVYNKTNDKTHVNIAVKNYDNEKECIETGNKWKKVGKLQKYTCITEYSDSGKECNSSSECGGDCIITKTDGEAFCSKDNNIFGCKSTIENIKAGGLIMCVD